MKIVQVVQRVVVVNGMDEKRKVGGNGGVRLELNRRPMEIAKTLKGFEMAVRTLALTGGDESGEKARARR